MILLPKVGRNDPCPCGSGKKYKKCCMLKDLEQELENQPDEEIPQEKKERRHPRADEIENNLNRAYKLLDERDFDHAARIFRNIMLMDGQHYKAMTGLGRCLIEMGMTEEACGFFEKALEINPDYTQASLNLALYRKK